MKKGIAVPYIIAIILGIAVIGLVGYWFFVAGGRLGTSASKTQCEQYRLQYCQEWQLKGYTTVATEKPWVWSGENDDERTKGCSVLGVPEPNRVTCEGLAGT